MGLFSKKPNGSQKVYIQSAINEVQTQYKEVSKTDRIDWFLEAYQKTYNSMDFLINAEKKLPSYFGAHRPTYNMQKIHNERPETERKFIDRFILSIEKKLLNYSTERGKRNNFNKEVEKFRYYAGEFLPESVNYFEQLIKKRFTEYL